MRRLILSALVMLGMMAHQASAQTFSIAQDTVANNTSGMVDLHNTVTNTSGGDLFISWRMITGSTTLASGWAIDQVCDNLNCYLYSSISGGASKTTDTIHAGGTMDFKVSLNATNGTNLSESWVTIRMSDVNGPTSKTAVFSAKKNATGVLSVTRVNDDIVLYPNPAKDNLNVIFDPNAGVKSIAVYNLIGKVVTMYKVSGGSAKLDVDSIPSGIYFIRLLDAQGRIIATRKFTHQ